MKITLENKNKEKEEILFQEDDKIFQLRKKSYIFLFGIYLLCSIIIILFSALAFMGWSLRPFYYHYYKYYWSLIFIIILFFALPCILFIFLFREHPIIFSKNGIVTSYWGVRKYWRYSSFKDIKERKNILLGDVFIIYPKNILNRTLVIPKTELTIKKYYPLILKKINKNSNTK